MANSLGLAGGLLIAQGVNAKKKKEKCFLIISGIICWITGFLIINYKYI